MVNKFPKVSIIVTNYNGGQVLLDCIETLKKIDYPNFEVVLVDNRSVDGSFDKAVLNKGNLNLVHHKNKSDLGFTGANNKGYELSSGKYMLLLNNDTKVPHNILSILVKKMEADPKIGAAQVKIKMMDVLGHLDNAGSFLTRTGFLVHWGFGKKDSEEFNKQKIIFSAKGACLITRREVVEKVGLFDADFVSYIEETDFCWRVWLAGYKIYYLPQTYIYHKVGYTFSKQFNPIVVNYNSFKNRILTLYKNLEFKNLLLILLPHLFILICLSIFYILRLQTEKFSMIQRAIWWNIKNIKDSTRKRKFVQSIRVKSDNQIFKFILKKFDFKEMFAHFIKVESNFATKRVS